MKTVLNMFVAVVVGLCLAGGSMALAQEKPTPPAGQDKVAADLVTGEWEGTVDMPDGAMPFSMKLKLEKDKVTGEVGSQQGVVAITDGSFVDGKLTVTFTYVDGNGVAMTGTLADGQFGGSLNYGAGQMVTTWAAKRRPVK
jgi:hypothetical protein